MIETEKCQNHCLPQISEGKAKTEKISIFTRIKLLLKRYLPSKNKKQVKQRLNTIMCLLKRQDNMKVMTPGGKTAAGALAANVTFKPGDMVRVKTLEEIKATLDVWNEYRGCMFMDAMAEFCGTTQRVLHPVERFVDERDYLVKKAKGVVLIEGLICHGTPSYGRCDRACYYFWRNEWLEKISQWD
ncbi:MAG: hypothetical protein WC370_03440 [Dehalococcoidales bacterium]|jgi:hypothetical protein